MPSPSPHDPDEGRRTAHADLAAELGLPELSDAQLVALGAGNPADEHPPCIVCGAPEPDHDEGCMVATFGAPVHVYTREQALEDGVLVDARMGDFAEVTRQHVPGEIPVVMTRGLFELIRRAVENEKHCNDYRGVWHDVLWMSAAARRAARQRIRAGFRLIITGAGRRRLHTLVVAWDGAAFTYMLEGED